MKKLTQFISEAASVGKITGISNSINYINADDLQKYLEVADICLCDETKQLVKWLIVNNKTYLQDLMNDVDENVIVGFYNQGVNKIDDDKLKDLWYLIKEINKKDRILEIPNLQTPKEFKDIISGKVPADYVILRLGTEEGRNNAVIKYENLINKIVNQWMGKSLLNRDDLKSHAYMGFTWALNEYGKKGSKTKAEDQNIVNKTFGQFAAYMIRFSILEGIKNESHTVRIPISQQQKEKQEKGSNRKSHTISGDKAIKKNDEGGKTLFDFLGFIDTSAQSIDNEDMDRLWNQAMDIIDKEFDDVTLDIFYSFFGINGHKKLQNKELAAKYGFGPSKVTYYCSRVINYIKRNQKIKSLFAEINELMHECQAEKEQNDNDLEPYHINISEDTSEEE